jgi:hypothetical protein
MSIVIEKFPNTENVLAVRDNRYTYRYLDMFGDCQKHIIDGTKAKDDTTSNPLDFVITATNTAPVTWSVLADSSFLITTAATEYSGDNIQVNGSIFQLSANKPAYFGIKAAISDATQSDFLVGLCGVDTTLTAASAAHAIGVGAGGLFFSKLDGSTTVAFKAYATSAETATANSGTAMDTSAHVYEIFWDGTTAFGYIDNALVGTFTSGLPSVVLTPSISFRAGEAGAKTMTVSWMRTFQVRG